MKEHLKTILPLAALTAISMSAIDMYLPAVPHMPDSLGGSVAQAQWTLASFMALLAVSQIFWGWIADSYGEAFVIRAGMFIMLGSTVACALSSDIIFLIYMRAIQGFGAGAATAVVPSLIKKRFAGNDAIRSISMVNMVESLIPAFAPVIGALILTIAPWQVLFWIIAVCCALLIPNVNKVIGHQAETKPLRSPLKGLYGLLRNREYMRFALAYSIMFSALVMFVLSAPRIIVHTFDLTVAHFSAMQIMGVASFILAASQGGNIVARYGVPRILKIGAILQIISFIIFIGMGITGSLELLILIFGWALFCMGLGLRGPSCMAGALDEAMDTAGQASGFIMFLSFGLSSITTALIAPLIDYGMLPISIFYAILITISIWIMRKNKKNL